MHCDVAYKIVCLFAGGHVIRVWSCPSKCRDTYIIYVLVMETFSVSKCTWGYFKGMLMMKQLPEIMSYSNNLKLKMASITAFHPDIHTVWSIFSCPSCSFFQNFIIVSVHPVNTFNSVRSTQLPEKPFTFAIISFVVVVGGVVVVLMASLQQSSASYSSCIFATLLRTPQIRTHLIVK